MRRGTANQGLAAGLGHCGTDDGRLWQWRSCALGVRTVVAEAAALAQGTEGALSMGGSGSREARWECCAGSSGEGVKVNEMKMRGRGPFL